MMEEEEKKPEKKDYYDPPMKNLPCKTCGKPTRSHHDNRTGEVQCHVCWLAENPEDQEEEE